MISFTVTCDSVVFWHEKGNFARFDTKTAKIKLTELMSEISAIFFNI